jgi:hypothetical protein
MIGTPKEVSTDLVMAALSALITGETDGNEPKMERLRHCKRLAIQIDTSIDTSPLAIRGFDAQEEGEDAEMLFEVTDTREKWRTWANKLGLRLPQKRG